MKKYILTWLILNGLLLKVSAQVGLVTPKKPSVTDTISVTYNSNLPEAKLNSKQVVFARFINYLQDGSIAKFHKALINEGGIMRSKIILPPLTAYFEVEFYTLNKQDENAKKEVVVYESGGFVPVKGAYLEGLFSNKADSIFELEIANHPDNYYAYARYFNVINMIKDPATAKGEITRMMKKLDSLTTNSLKIEPTAGLLAAKTVGYVKIGNLSMAKSALFELFNLYPTATETNFAFGIYNYEYYKINNKDIEDDVRSGLKSIFLNYPNAAICRNVNMFEYLKKDKDIPTSAFEKVARLAYANDGIPYYGMGNLPSIYIERQEKLDTAKKLVKQAIALFQNGEINHQYQLNFNHYRMYVPLLIYQLACINSLQQEHHATILNSSSAIQLITGSDVEGNFLPLMLQLRAKAYYEIGNYNLALEDYKKLYINGESTVLDSMEKIFPWCNLEQRTFTDFISTLKKNESLKVDYLPNFTGTDLKGKKISLADLKGKIVVLNVWGIGCGPCIAEMPELNQLVKSYKNKEAVVFIGITADRKEDLIEFFKTRTFDYRVLINVSNIPQIFNSNVLPMHLVIGKNGEVLNKSVGASGDIKSFLKRIIDANL